MGGFKVTNVAESTDDKDALTMKYVDNRVTRMSCVQLYYFNMLMHA